MESIQNSIELRKSTRSYNEIPIQTEELKAISKLIADPINQIGPYGNKIKLDLVVESIQNEKVQIGTYGFIQNAQAYVFGGAAVEKQILFDYGYVLENIVLALTELGIGTCWLGGRFKKQEAMSLISLQKEEVIPAIVTLGYPKAKPRLKEVAVRTILKASKRKPEEMLFFHERFGQPLGNEAPEFSTALHYLRIAPSAQNKQPWRLVFDADLSRVHFYITQALKDHPLYMCEPEYLDIGIAFNHFERGLKEAGIYGVLTEKEPAIQKPEGYIYITTWQRSN